MCYKDLIGTFKNSLSDCRKYGLLIINLILPQDHDQTNKQLVFHLNEYLNNETLSHRRRKNFAPKELNIIISKFNIIISQLVQ